jgi:hypothetical protein
MPAMPTGARPTGIFSVWPRVSTVMSSLVMSRITRWRSAMASRSATFRRSVSSAYEPPSMYSKKMFGSLRRASSR